MTNGHRAASGQSHQGGRWSHSLPPQERLAKIGEVLLQGVYLYAVLSDEATLQSPEQHGGPERTDGDARLEAAPDDSTCEGRRETQGPSGDGASACG